MSEETTAFFSSTGKNLIWSGYIGDQLLVELIRHADIGVRKKRGSGDVRLILNSLGGCLYTMMGIVDWIRVHGQVRVIATGACMSAAVPIVACGKRGDRYATPYTRFMLHASSASYEYERPLSVRFVKNEVREWAAVDGAYAAVLAEATKHKDAAWWQARIRDERRNYFDAETAKDYGIIDHILEAE